MSSGVTTVSSPTWRTWSPVRKPAASAGLPPCTSASTTARLDALCVSAATRPCQVRASRRVLIISAATTFTSSIGKANPIPCAPRGPRR